MEREKLTGDINISINIYADLFEINTDYVQQFAINISDTQEERKTERQKSRGT